MKRAEDGIQILPIQLNITRVYLLKLNDNLVLVDTSYPPQYTRFKKILAKKFNISLGDITWVFLTHHHDDHSGFVSPLLEESGARFAVHENALPHLEAGKSLEDDDSYYISKRALRFFKFFEHFHPFTFPPLKPREKDFIIHGQDPVAFPEEIGIVGQFLYTPGHSSDSISILLPGGELFCGDLFMNARWSNLLGKKLYPVYATDRLRLKESWTTISRLHVTTIYPAHGSPFFANKVKKNAGITT
ncbi:MAG TPA: MBL fold metallo-hydrolase [Candidatus Lokiarchaeia archaeon]|nr:MBL fold metallo-hydrolase [Candidatus Lokiarchaeia archaeon]